MVLERVKSFAVRRPDAFIIGVWTLVVVAAFLPYFIVGGWSPKFYQWMSETTLLHVPHWNFTGGMLKAGLVPTWTPHVYCGFPHHSFPGANLHFPPFYLLMFMDFARAGALSSLLCYSLGGAFAHLGYRRAGLSPVGALVAMLATVGGMWAMFETSFYWGERELLAQSLCGWGVASMSRGFFRWRYFAGIASGVYLLLSYHVEPGVYMCVFFTGLAFFMGPSEGRIKRTFLTMTAIAAAGLCLSSAGLGLVEYGPWTLRADGLTFEYFTRDRLTPGTFFPGLAVPLTHAFLNMPAPVYLGLSVLWLCGLLVARRAREFVRVLATIFFFMLVVVDAWPVANLLYHVPVLKLIVLHYYVFSGIVILVGFLAGHGAEELIERGLGSRWWWLPPLALALVLAASEPSVRGPLMVVPAGLALVAIIRPSFFDSRARRAAWVAAFVALDLTFIALVHRSWTKMERFNPHPAAREIIADAGRERFWPLSKIKKFTDNHLNANVGMQLDPFLPGTSSPRGYLRMAPRRTVDLLNLVSPGLLEYQDGKLHAYRREVGTGPDPFAPGALPILSLMNTGWIISRKVELPAFPELERRRASDLIVYRNRGSLRRARAVSNWRVAADGSESLALVGSGQLDFARESVLESRAGWLTSHHNDALPPQILTRRASPGYWELEVTGGEAESAVVVAETLTPGWRAFLDGQETLLHRSYHAFMGVIVPAGNHDLVLYHAPRAFQIGLWASIVSMICWPIAWMIGSRCQKKDTKTQRHRDAENKKS